MSAHEMTEVTKTLKPFNLMMAMASFGACTAMLAVADSALGYGLAAWNLAGSVVIVWQGRLWQ
ncbi:MULTISPECIES: hypothetical protein [Pseudomonas syringae group]|uniref:Membrane protein n=2 Tax=Pseudomonas syringae group TaxID=136849 RepID=A0ABY1UB55_PSESX|nr:MULTISPECIES: hypothetical protein [Pseudomonas syringae group]KWT12047.1 hypothetical protein AL046_14210 [Pseudomonas syringae pv. avii]SOQ10370.1 hypothetical protein CFBP1573P_03050 [Pseudomonas syringae pv. persicae]SOQ11870.1 hypothetical protein NCPPB2254_03582 [Pseudomonas syringae pv. persicae]SOS28068.1 putative membrane protein [Pseudomonas syringae pv. avii]